MPLGRRPPVAVTRQLRADQGFLCAIPDCTSPYLEWHHFDPPWHVKNHHDVEGMVELCSTHHPHGDAGAWTVDQLREFKNAARARGGDVSGRFEWLRRDIVVMAGSNAFKNCPVALEVRGEPVISFNRDEGGHALLNVRMPQTSRSRRAVIEDNWWTVRGNPSDVECLPGGKSLAVKYANGDRLRIEFLEVLDETHLADRYPTRPSGLRTPFTAVEIELDIPDWRLRVRSTELSIGGGTISQSMVEGCGTGIAIR